MYVANNAFKVSTTSSGPTGKTMLGGHSGYYSECTLNNGVWEHGPP